MQSNQDKHLVKYLLFGGVLGVSYLLINYLAKAKSSKARATTLLKTLKVLKEIKYQMLNTSFSYAEAVGKKQKGSPSDQDLEIAFRTEMAKICVARQDAVMAKHDLSRDEFTVSLQAYKKDSRVQQEQSDILEMMECSIKGRIPDLTVTPQASQLLSNQQVGEVYLQMVELIAINIWEKLDQHKKVNPGFNSRDEMHYKKAMKEVSIYDIKTSFLESKGFQQAWGAPNEVFYKIIESLKQRSNQFKSEIAKTEKAFDKVVEKIQTEPDNFNQERIKFFMVDIIQQQGIQSQPKPQGMSKSVNRAAPPPAKHEEDDLESMMMKELLSRSAEEPKPKDEEPKQEPEKKVEESNENIVEEAKEQVPAEVQKEEEVKEDKEEETKEVQKEEEQKEDKEETKEDKKEEVKEDKEEETKEVQKEEVKEDKEETKEVQEEVKEDKKEEEVKEEKKEEEGSEEPKQDSPVNGTETQSKQEVEVKDAVNAPESQESSKVEE